MVTTQRNRKINILIVILMLIFLSSTLLGCTFITIVDKLMNPVNDIGATEYLLYRRDRIEDKVYSVEIYGTTEKANKESESGELEYLIIPDRIEGVPVVSIAGRGKFKVPTVKKIYVGKNVQRMLMTGTFGNNDTKVLYSRHEPSRPLIGRPSFLDKQYTIYVSVISNENYNDALDDKKPVNIANINYLLNFRNSWNGGVHFIDDLDNGEKIEVIPDIPQREGYEFCGWYEEKECKTKFYIENFIQKNEETILNLYAGWEKYKT